MIKLSYDLHIHSCLSPCGDDDMTPANIVGMSALKNLDVIAVTDHNSSKNCEAVLEAAQNHELIVIPGMELCTSEEVHVLCLFNSFEGALAFDKLVYEKLIKIPNNEAIFGKQEIYDSRDILKGREQFLLINATKISFDQVYDLMVEYDGIMIPAHIDKGSNSLLSNLGFVPPTSRFTSFEISKKGEDEIVKANPYLKKCKVVRNSDAHYLHHINEAENYIFSKSIKRQDIIEALKGGK